MSSALERDQVCSCMMLEKVRAENTRLRALIKLLAPVQAPLRPNFSCDVCRGPVPTLEVYQEVRLGGLVRGHKACLETAHPGRVDRPASA